jgi:ATP-binding cassette ChvD family protein
MKLKPGQPLLTGKDIRKSFGERQVLRGLTFWILPGDHIGIIGPNGAGKSTFLKIMSGQEKHFEGALQAADGLEIGYVEQEPRLDPEKTVRENIDDGLRHIHDLLARFDALNEKLGTDLTPDEMQAVLDEQADVQSELDAKEAWDIDRRIEVAMAALRCPPADARAGLLSGGEKRRVALCATLMQHPDLLILDEPTNHLDASTIEWLEGYLGAYTGAYVLVTHDRYFLDKVVNNMWEIVDGKGRGFQGCNYSAYLEQKAREQEIAARTQERREALYERELEWIRSNPAARTTKSRARVKNFEALQKEMEQEKAGELDLVIPTGPPLSDKVVRVTGLKKAFGGRALIDGLSFELPKGGIVGVTGPNGAGKTTLVRMLMGLEKPDEGSIEIGERTKFCYVDQGRDTIDPEKTVYEEISGGLDWVTWGTQKINIRGYLARFNFKGAIQQTRCGQLSGGERNRVQMAKLLRGGGNVIVLDEPTNDLDLYTLRTLEEALLRFPGCAIVITHDRYFLNRIATHTLVFEGGGKVVWCEGSYETYQELKKLRDAESGAKQAVPSKDKHRKMVK